MEEPERTSIRPSPEVPGPTWSRDDVPFALLAHPAVQIVRFASKVGTAWFISTEAYGEAMLAGLVVFGVQHVAVFGLDETLISTRPLSGNLWRRMRAFQNGLGLGLAFTTAAIGLALSPWPDEALLGHLLMALAPMIAIANRATLPTALLVRERRFAKVFLVDLFGISAFTAVTLALAACGLGAWSFVGGWYANAITCLLSSEAFARPLHPVDTSEPETWSEARARGSHLTGAAVLGYVGERSDSAAVGFVLGRAVLGLYEFALNLSQVMVNYTASLSERLLFPTLAAHHRGAGLANATLRALRVVMMFLVPLHVTLAFVAGPIVTVFFPARWHAAEMLVSVLALAAAARCFDVVAVTSMKAAGHSRSVLRLSLMRLALLVAALLCTLHLGPLVAAIAVLAARSIAALLALSVATLRLDLGRLRTDARIARALFTTLVWLAVFVPAALWFVHWLVGRPGFQLVALSALALGLWGLVRAAFDHEDFADELDQVGARLAALRLRDGRGSG